MNVVISDYTYDDARCVFKIVKQIDRDGVLDVNEHWVPLASIRNYSSYYGVSEDVALNFILFHPFMAEEDLGDTFEDALNNCIARVYKGTEDELDLVHDFVMAEVERSGTVPETSVDSPCGDSGAAREPGSGEQYRKRRDNPQRSPDGMQRVPGAVRDAGVANQPTAGGQASAAGR